MRGSRAKRGKMQKVMDEFKSGTLHSGSKRGPKVTSRAQAIAIGLKQSGQSKYNGGGGRRALRSRRGRRSA